MKHKCDGCKYKGEHQEMMFKPFGVCLKFYNLVEAEKAYKADKCPFKKTNFDRIKAMSVEEMAEKLARDNACSFCKKTEFQTCDNITCKQGIIQYLESEVQEDES